MQTLPTMLTWVAGAGRHAGLATPSPSMTVDPDAVTPGFVGFVAIALIAVVVVFLLIDMLRRIRRAGYRADINEQLDAEAAAPAEGVDPASGDAAPGASDGPEHPDGSDGRTRP